MRPWWLSVTLFGELATTSSQEQRGLSWLMNNYLGTNFRHGKGEIIRSVFLTSGTAVDPQKRTGWDEAMTPLETTQVAQGTEEIQLPTAQASLFELDNPNVNCRLGRLPTTGRVRGRLQETRACRSCELGAASSVRSRLMASALEDDCRQSLSKMDGLKLRCSLSDGHAPAGDSSCEAAQRCESTWSNGANVNRSNLEHSRTSEGESMQMLPRLTLLWPQAS